jgi:SAM-dependent methyltransferase
MTTFDASHRSQQDELMDTEPVSFEEFRACLVDLSWVNRVTLAYRPTLAFFDRLLPQARALNRPLEVVDVGSGYGDMLRAIDAWAVSREVAVSLTGVDLNPWSRKAALAATAPGRPIQWVTADAFAFDPKGGIDVVVSSLFTHHLPDPLVVKLLTWMETNARLGFFVNDLHRHAVPFHFFRHFAKAARLHRFVQHDGPVSIARAFVAADWRRLLEAAAIPLGAAHVRWEVPFRLTVERRKR